MYSTIHTVPGNAHLSRRERQQLRRAEALSRRACTASSAAPQVRLSSEELELIERLVRHDRTAVSTALLMIAGIGAGHTRRVAVLAAVEELALAARAGGTIGSRTADQIAEHTRQELDRSDPTLAT